MSNSLLSHPTNGTSYFGLVEEKRVGQIIIPGGPIVLKVGKHSERGGFGAAHIWGKHSLELGDAGFTCLDEVPNYVAEIIRPGAPIYCEFNNLRGNHRVTVIRTTTGLAILEYRNEVYSVVTAYAQKNAHGTRIGSVRDLG